MPPYKVDASPTEILDPGSAADLMGTSMPLQKIFFLIEGCLKHEVEPVVCTLVQCTPLLAENAGVAQVWLFGSTYASKKECRPKNNPGFKTRGDGDDHTKSKVGISSGPTKWTLIQQK